MQLHITRIHDGVYPGPIFDSPTSSSKDVRDSFLNQNIESVANINDDMDNSFAGDTYWESEEEDESPPIQGESLTKNRVEYYPNAGEFYRTKQSIAD